MTPGMLLAVGAALCLSRTAQAAPRVLGFSLPGQNGDALAPRVERVTEELARSVGGTIVADADPNRKLLELAAPLERALSLARRAMFDEAAVSFDELLGVALHAPQRVDAPAQLVASMIARVSIAIARHEPKRATELLDRLLRYDPAVTLSPSEDEPGVHTLLQQLRRKLGSRPALGPEELGSACRAADLLVVARTIEGGRIEMSRFDDCRLVARNEIAVGGDDHAIVAALAQPADAEKRIVETTANPVAPSTPHVEPPATADTTPAPTSMSNTRVERVAGWATLGVGLGALGLGGTFAALAKATNDDIVHPSSGAVWSPALQDRLHVYEGLDIAFFAIGGAAVVAGSVVEILGHRHGVERTTASRSVRNAF